MGGKHEMAPCWLGIAVNRAWRLRRSWVLGAGDTLGVGQRVEDLVARQGQPQEIQPGPGGGKTYVYTTANLDQTAAMGGGAWVKPDQVHYRLNDQGVITNVKSIFLQWREDTKKNKIKGFWKERQI